MTGLSRFPVKGGSAELVVKLAPDEAVFASAFSLPGGAYLVSVHATTSTDDASRVVVVIPGNSQRLVIAEEGGSPTFVAHRGSFRMTTHGIECPDINSACPGPRISNPFAL